MNAAAAFDASFATLDLHSTLRGVLNLPKVIERIAHFARENYAEMDEGFCVKGAAKLKGKALQAVIARQEFFASLERWTEAVQAGDASRIDRAFDNLSQFNPMLRKGTTIETIQEAKNFVYEATKCN